MSDKVKKECGYYFSNGCLARACFTNEKCSAKDKAGGIMYYRHEVSDGIIKLQIEIKDKDKIIEGLNDKLDTLRKAYEVQGDALKSEKAKSVGIEELERLVDNCDICEIMREIGCSDGGERTYSIETKEAQGYFRKLITSGSGKTLSESIENAKGKK